MMTFCTAELLSLEASCIFLAAKRPKGLVNGFKQKEIRRGNASGRARGCCR